MPHSTKLTKATCSLYIDTQLCSLIFVSRSRIASATLSLCTSVSWRVTTWRSFTTPFASSDSPKMAATGIPISSQYCSCASNFGFCLYECSACNDKNHEHDHGSNLNFSMNMTVSLWQCHQPKQLVSEQYIFITTNNTPSQKKGSWHLCHLWN